jgi:hypothetical protein
LRGVLGIFPPLPPITCQHFQAVLQGKFAASNHFRIKPKA